MIDSIKWSELGYPVEESVHFERNGSERSLFFWGRRKTDGRWIRCGKVFKNFVFMPLLLSIVSIVSGIGVFFSFLNSNSTMISIFCVYLMVMLLSFYYLVDNYDPVYRWM